MRALWIALFVACSSSPKSTTTTCPVCPVCPVAKSDPVADPPPGTPPVGTVVQEPPPKEPTSKMSADDLETSKLGRSSSQADIASRLNRDGVELAKKQKFNDASAKLRDAIARLPEPKYFLNLCFTLYSEGKFGEALTACAAVDGAPAFNEKRDKFVEHIKYQAALQKIKLE
jgi:hypothetical protein